jgi:ParB-like chromosome segregation protein Spo0J
MDIKNIPIEEVIPYEKNPRKNLNVDKVAISISEFGFQQPIVVDRNMVIIAGHTRWEASKKLGLKTVPVLIANLDPVKAKAYRIADNKTNEGSQWDMNLLNLEFTDLLDINYNLENLGFDPKELEEIIVDKESFEPTSADDQGAIDKDTKVICKDCGKRLYE